MAVPAVESQLQVVGAGSRGLGMPKGRCSGSTGKSRRPVWSVTLPVSAPTVGSSLT